MKFHVCVGLRTRLHCRASVCLPVDILAHKTRFSFIMFYHPASLEPLLRTRIVALNYMYTERIIVSHLTLRNPPTSSETHTKDQHINFPSHIPLRQSWRFSPAPDQLKMRYHSTKISTQNIIPPIHQLLNPLFGLPLASITPFTVLKFTVL